MKHGPSTLQWFDRISSDELAVTVEKISRTWVEDEYRELLAEECVAWKLRQEIQLYLDEHGMVVGFIDPHPVGSTEAAPRSISASEIEMLARDTGLLPEDASFSAPSVRPDGQLMVVARSRSQKWTVVVDSRGPRVTAIHPEDLADE